jgi:catechol 2,3-dioxygenase-like lactoylglutathione lyase family enzyme
MIHIKKLNHVDIIIPRGKEADARSFYCNFLGLKEIEKPNNLKSNGGMWLEIENSGIQIHLSVQDNYDPTTTKAHIAYEVVSLEALKSKLMELSIKIHDNTPVPGFTRFDIRDPFGNRIEFLQATNQEE